MQAGCAVDLPDHEGLSPLLIAAKHGHSLVVQELLRYIQDSQRQILAHIRQSRPESGLHFQGARWTCQTTKDPPPS